MDPINPPRLSHDDARQPKKKLNMLAWKALSANKRKVIEGLAWGLAHSSLAPFESKGFTLEGFARGTRSYGVFEEEGGEDVVDAGLM